MSFDPVAPIHLPFAGGKFRLAMGLRPLRESEWLEPGANLAADLAAKRILLETRHAEVFAARPEAALPAAELLRLIALHLAQYDPTMFGLTGDRLTNVATAESWNLAQPSLHPLDLAGRVVAEDLCLLRSSGDGLILVGASLCSPARWLLAEKIGRPIEAIHAAVPGYAAALGQPVAQFLGTLKPNRLFGRFNWGISDNPAPFQPVPPAEAARVTPESAGEKLWLRVERQTLRRLPETGAVVFTIRTHITRLDQAIRSQTSARDLAAAIRDMPQDLQRYKCLAPIAPALLDWLDQRTKNE
jgi:dimethylamine monooxygenase subunit A